MKAEFGDIITVTQRLKRVHKGVKRYWEPYPTTPVECVIIGIRTLSDGHVDCYTEDTFFSYYETGRFQVYLVAVKNSLTINPFYTPIL